MNYNEPTEPGKGLLITLIVAAICWVAIIYVIKLLL